MRLVFLICILITSGKTLAQDSTRCNCCTEPYRQFDFWIGDWEVRDSAGTLLGHNLIELEQDSCTLRENWIGASGGTGTSLSFYIARKKQWHQTWVDKWGGSILMDGKLEGKSMVLYTDKILANDGETYVRNKTSWTPMDDGRVHHVWEQTRDDGKTWTVVFDGYYKRK